MEAEHPAASASGRTAPPRPLAMRTGALVAAALLIAGCSGGDDLAAPPSLVEDRPAANAAEVMALVEAQVAFGPRIPGSEGHQAQLAWMVERLDRAADTVLTQSFTHTHSETDEELPLTNVLARFNPDADRRLLFLAHWDTRPQSDAADTPERRAIPVPGANDGGSGVAVLLHVADLLGEQAPEVGVDILLVDGEDLGPTTADMFLGARHYALNQLAPEPVYGVLLDMVGDAAPRFPMEQNSVVMAPNVVNRVWNVAHALGYGPFFPRISGGAITDDHIPLNQVGIPTIDVIDFEYGPGNVYWHTPEDDVDQVRPATLQMVAEVVLELIYMGG